MFGPAFTMALARWLTAYGGLDTDFGRFANLADQRLAPFAWRDSPAWHPRDDRFDDGALVTQAVGRYEPNPWGLYDMHGNVAEWTRTEYRPYPYNLRDGRDEPGGTGPKVVRGGSWYDRPKRACYPLTCQFLLTKLDLCGKNHISYPFSYPSFRTGEGIPCEHATSASRLCLGM